MNHVLPAGVDDWSAYAPGIGIAMATYNGGRFLEAQLSSFLAQTRQPDLLVVVDDASHDETWSILEQFRNEAPFLVELHRHDVNQGLSPTFQQALSACSAEVVVLSDQDDVWLPEKLASVAAAFRDPTVSVWFSDALFVDDADRSLGRTLWEKVKVGPDLVTELAQGAGQHRLLHASTVAGTTMAVRREVVELALPLPAEVGTVDHVFLHDGWLAVVGSLLGRTVAEPDQLVRYRQHQAQWTSLWVAANQGVPQPSKQEVLEREARRVSLVARRVAEAGVEGPAAGDLVRHAAFLNTRLRAIGRGAFLPVLRLWLEGSYRRWSRGYRTAGADLARVARSRTRCVRNRVPHP